MQSGIDEGAEVVCGAKRPGFAKGFFYEPTVLIGTNEMRIAEEEIFGPVLTVIPYSGSDDDAVRIANDSQYGLAGAVMSASTARSFNVARRIRAGNLSATGVGTAPWPISVRAAARGRAGVCPPSWVSVKQGLSAATSKAGSERMGIPRFGELHRSQADRLELKVMTEHPIKGKPTVRMTDDEAWDMIDSSLVGILTTLRRDGVPIALPLWYVVVNKHIYTSTRGKKLQRIRTDTRSSFLVESGKAWSELRAVHLTGRVEILEPDTPETAIVRDALDRKYAPVRSTGAPLPQASKQAYANAAFGVVKFDPTNASWPGTTARCSLRGHERQVSVDGAVVTANDVEGLQVTWQGSLLRITFDRPAKKNALTAAMVDALLGWSTLHPLTPASEVLSSPGRRPSAPVWNLDRPRSGDGSGDGKKDRPRPGAMVRTMHAGPHKLVQALYELELPVVAGVRGTAAGIGLSIALAADYIVSGKQARFWAPFVSRGFSADSGTTYILPRLVGVVRAKEMLLFGRSIDGLTAAEWGLINAAVDEKDLDATLDEVAAQIAGAATIALGVTKQLVRRNLEGTLESSLQNEAFGEEVSLRSADFKEGLAAFLERRPPMFTGR